MRQSAQTAIRPDPGDELKDHFVVRRGISCAGVHLLVELFDVNPIRLRDEGHIDRTLRDCIDASGATLLHIHLHPFEENGGISGVAVLAESHISIHTWPEVNFAALDIFMCGKASPDACIPVLQKAFGGRIEVQEILRGKHL